MDPCSAGYVGAMAERGARRDDATDRQGPTAESRQGPEAPEAPGVSEELPPALASVLAEYERHLRVERDLSAHSVRAYHGDAESLLHHVARAGADRVEDVTLPALREWLAAQHSAGRSRATLARRTAAARAFTAYAHRRGLLEADPGPLLGTPKAHRTL